MDIFQHIPKLKSLIEQSERIVILTHYNPDGDAIGSSVAWYDYLQNIGKNSQIVIPNDFPQNLKWIKGSETALIANQNMEKAEALITNADLLICNDFQSFSRIDKLEEIAKKSSATKVLVDHHIDPEIDQFDLIFSNVESSSTAELTFELITRLTPEKPVSTAASEAIYTGIMTDTGSFSYSCNHKKTFEIVAKLIDLGIDARCVHQDVYNTFSEDRMRLLGHCLTNRLTVLPEFSTAYMYLTKEDLRDFRYVPGDTEGIVNYALSIKGIKFSAFFIERESRIRISFRSKDEIDCNEFAKTFFNGGGHRNASGGNSFENIQETIQKFEKLLPEFKQKNNF
ncbi:MAG: bifunctional oligoribonuclease/PAP phosphatase NrnA [Bacteroidales bacterium]|jgi:phosphoesterase RecJ-like protein|nr:bifunctional oligoribonuclease/PAP phosphatase NrnA [Bacteroidales bacterium]